MNFFENFSHLSSSSNDNNELNVHRLRARDLWMTLSAQHEDMVVCQQLVSTYSHTVHESFTTVLLDSGVALYDIHTFVEQYPTLAHKYIFDPENGTWRTRMLDAFIEAYWSTSMVLFVPPTVHSDIVIDLRALLAPYSTDKVIEKCVIIVQAHAHVTILDRGIASDNNIRTVIRSVDCVVGDYATATLHVVQQSVEVEYEYVSYSLQAGCKSSVHMIAGISAAARSKIVFDCLPHGKHSAIYLRGLAAVGANQSLLCTSMQHHPAALGSSDVMIKACVGNAGFFDYQGSVLIAKDAAQSSAHQRNMVLLLADNARARSLPILEVVHNDVSCSHGSALGQLDKQQLFYMQTRGLSVMQARTVLMRGFMDDILTQITSVDHELLAHDMAIMLSEDAS